MKKINKTLYDINQDAFSKLEDLDDELDEETLEDIKTIIRQTTIMAHELGYQSGQERAHEDEDVCGFSRY